MASCGGWLLHEVDPVWQQVEEPLQRRELHDNFAFKTILNMVKTVNVLRDSVLRSAILSTVIGDSSSIQTHPRRILASTYYISLYSTRVHTDARVASHTY